MGKGPRIRANLVNFVNSVYKKFCKPGLQNSIHLKIIRNERWRY